MITKQEHEAAVKKTLDYFKKAGISLTELEKKRIEIADFGLNNLTEIGLEILTYVNTERVCSKELVLFPFQTCPQHKHVDSNAGKGKEETFRCRSGTVFLYVSGTETNPIRGKIPTTPVDVFHEIILREGEQYTLMPNTWHWFQAGEEGAVVSEFSTQSTDETDIFLDNHIIREPKIASYN